MGSSMSSSMSPSAAAAALLSPTPASGPTVVQARAIARCSCAAPEAAASPIPRLQPCRARPRLQPRASAARLLPRATTRIIRRNAGAAATAVGADQSPPLSGPTSPECGEWSPTAVAAVAWIGDRRRRPPTAFGRCRAAQRRRPQRRPSCGEWLSRRRMEFVSRHRICGTCGQQVPQLSHQDGLSNMHIRPLIAPWGCVFDGVVGGVVGVL